MIDKKSLLIGILTGTLLGIIASIFIVSIIISSIGESFKVENMNIIVDFNQTALEELIRESPGYQDASASEQIPIDYKKEWTGSPEDIGAIND